MTITQTARISGIRAAMKIRGVCVSVKDGTKFTALIDKTAPSADSNQISRETRNASVVCILRCDLGAANITPGTVFLTDTRRYRVSRVDAEAIDVLARFTCEECEIATA